MKIRVAASINNGEAHQEITLNYEKNDQDLNFSKFKEDVLKKVEKKSEEVSEIKFLFGQKEISASDFDEVLWGGDGEESTEEDSADTSTLKNQREIVIVCHITTKKTKEKSLEEGDSEMEILVKAAKEKQEKEEIVFEKKEEETNSSQGGVFSSLLKCSSGFFSCWPGYSPFKNTPTLVETAGQQRSNPFLDSSDEEEDDGDEKTKGI